MATPGRPRQSGIPGPGRASSIPTPGRSRSNSNIHQNYDQTQADDITRAFADAIKANDPSMHRNNSLANSISTSSLSPQSGAFSGRRSVAGRPSSSASSSSTKAQDRIKTPISARVSSRPPSRSELSKPPKTFEVGDNVRIESLGFEGKLRYIGDIEGKPGLWAGVELSGGFSGKGKNNGSVDGKQYFNCPAKCGVFVATTKLSAPTVGPGAIQRPPSVASSRGGMKSSTVNSGRTTPSFVGMRTPSASFSNGRVTPSTGGRITPSDSSGRITPNSSLPGLSQQRLFKTPSSKPKTVAPLSEKITAGSRASKYMTMTAQQLNSRSKTSPETSTRKSESSGISLNSPTMSRTLSSPSRSSGSPFSTPRAGSIRSSNAGGSPTSLSARNRTSMNTPRARIPSGVAMPPPPSPKALPLHHLQTGVNRSSPPQSRNDLLIQEKSTSSVSPFSSSSRPSSSTSFRSVGTDELAIIEQLQSRLDAAEYENERLRMSSEAAMASSTETEHLRTERDETLVKLEAAQTKILTLGELVKTQATDMEILQDENQRLRQELTTTAEQAEQDISLRRSEAESLGQEMKSLLDKLDEFEALVLQKDEINTTQASNIQDLSAELEKLQADFQEERKELNGQIDELRIAGQETIALYEERLSAANTQRYELEHRISILETSLKAAVSNHAPQEPASAIRSATEIDNETLQEQVQYLQKKSARLEEQLEDTRAALERDMVSYQDKISRIRMEEEQHKRDLNLKEREYEQLLKSEAGARNRVEEIEEALRESTVALESARGEVEALRTEMANLEVLIDDASEGDVSSKLTNFMRKMAADKSKYKQELQLLEKALEDTQAEKELLVNQMSKQIPNPLGNTQNNEDLLGNVNDSLRKQVIELEAKVVGLDQELVSRTAELEVLRKKSNREAALTNGTSETLSSKPEPSSEEVAELQKENLASAQQIKLLESENQLLSAEAEQLRQEIHILEENLDNSLEGDNDGAKAPRPLADQRTRFENDLDQARKRLSEAEMKHARTIHSLNKEISELEALVESKDELEQEIERLKDKLARQKKTSKNNGDPTEARQRLSTASISSAGTGALGGSREEEVCEICERPGHDIFNCSLLKEDKTGVVCEDCESPGHVAADCPHSLDVF
ncbi:Restin-like protein [Psilocybe cubensis]|uniref:Restin-like protein n=1 Tax=Psilocybe cubensis TaxID=181762 RepID=A0ACB8HDS7_PSICU|nr:Restin-like protein [Psilocybe cubensis]KAH9485329.1 Restin-like protein [Psilocybe cubensis]